MIKADLHIHTEYSMDCNMPLENIINRCLEKEINCVAIADHGTIEGALKMRNLAPFTVIVAEEVLSLDGEIMGVFLEESIPSGLSVEQTIFEIKAQGALICIPHAFDIFRMSALGEKIVTEIAGQIDVMEVFNSRSPLLRSSSKAQAFAQKYGIAESAGSDAHTIDEIGNSYVEMPEFNGRDDFLRALVQGKIIGKRTNPIAHISSTWAKLKNFNRR